MIAVAHSDSPAFKIREQAESETAGGYTRINVEKYGGMLCSTWLDRPLSAAGRVTLFENGKIVSRLVNLDRDLFLIPTVAIHMNRNANDGASYNPASDMQPIMGSTSVKGSYRRLLAEACGADEESILSSDMFLYPRCPGTVWGAEGEFL